MLEHIAQVDMFVRMDIHVVIIQLVMEPDTRVLEVQHVERIIIVVEPDIRALEDRERLVQHAGVVVKFIALEHLKILEIEQKAAHLVVRAIRQLTGNAIHVVYQMLRLNVVNVDMLGE